MTGISSSLLVAIEMDVWVWVLRPCSFRWQHMLGSTSCCCVGRW